MHRFAVTPVVTLVALLTALTAAAQPASAPPPPATPELACPAGNLLAGRAPWAWRNIRGDRARATDGEIAPEGAFWDAPLAVQLADEDASLTWDLGQRVPIGAAYLQADNNDSYTLFGSDDGRSFHPIGRLEPAPAPGLRARTASLGGAAVRYLRIGEGNGDGFYSLTELAVYCQVPTPFPPAMRVGRADAPVAATTIFSFWNDATSARWQLCLALIALALLLWGDRLAALGRPDAHAKLRTRALAVLGVLAALTFINFGFFHFGNFLHHHEWTHYYLGAKYHREVGYERLYECLTTADVEAGLRRRVERRTITNLKTNLLETTADVVAHPERCKQHFSPARWQAFTRDVAYFRGRMSPRGWDDLQFDHGYNATPVWNAVGTTLANLAPASATQINLLAALDPLYLLASAGIVLWAFGWRTAALALLIFATNFPSRFYWIGGAFSRYDWLFFTTATVACLRKERFALAGATLAAAAALRIFPVFMLIGPLAAAVFQILRTRTLEVRWRRFFAGAAIAGVLLFGFSLWRSGGIDAYRGFAANTTKHQDTAMVNNLGLRTVLAYRPAEVGRYLKDNRTDPWQTWKDAKLRSWRQVRWLAVPLCLAVVAGIALAARRGAPPWVLAALGVAFVPFAVELLSYYFAFIYVVALLAAAHPPLARWLLALTAFTQFVAWAPVRYMSTWLDEQYTLMSVGTLLVFAIAVVSIAARFAPPRPERAPA